jgi:hypothetical protein
MGACDLCLAHMPRAVGTFRKAGFEVLPSPVFHLSDIRQRDTLRIAIHECAGLVSYWFPGRTDAIFPRPSGEDRVAAGDTQRTERLCGRRENRPGVQILSNNPIGGSESAIPQHPPS